MFCSSLLLSLWFQRFVLFVCAFLFTLAVYFHFTLALLFLNVSLSTIPPLYLYVCFFLSFPLQFLPKHLLLVLFSFISCSFHLVLVFSGQCFCHCVTCPMPCETDKHIYLAQTGFVLIVSFSLSLSRPGIKSKWDSVRETGEAEGENGSGKENGMENEEEIKTENQHRPWRAKQSSQKRKHWNIGIEFASIANYISKSGHRNQPPSSSSVQHKPMQKSIEGKIANSNSETIAAGHDTTATNIASVSRAFDVDADGVVFIFRPFHI